MNFQSLSAHVAKRIGQRDAVRELLRSLQIQLENLKMEEIRIQKAATVIQAVAKMTQDQLELRISSTCSTALTSVMDQPYEFQIKFVTKRNRLEAEIAFVRDGQQLSPMDQCGGGAADIASFALRIALWSISANKPRATIICDEPFRNLSKDNQIKMSELLKTLSTQLDLQFIVISHEATIIESADRVIEVTNHQGTSQVKYELQN